MKEKLEKALIEVAIDIARKNEGALFVISNNVVYDLLLKQKFTPFKVLEEGANKLLLSIGTIDGAVVINTKGLVLDYGCMIKRKGNGILQGKGTRHQAAISASLYKDSTAILVSEEEHNVKIFKNGQMIMKIDALNQNIKEEINEVRDLLESAGFGAFTTIAGTSIAAMGLGTFGVALVPGVVLFGLPYYLIKKIRGRKRNE